MLNGLENRPPRVVPTTWSVLADTGLVNGRTFLDFPRIPQKFSGVRCSWLFNYSGAAPLPLWQVYAGGILQTGVVYSTTYVSGNNGGSVGASGTVSNFFGQSASAGISNIIPNTGSWEFPLLNLPGSTVTVGTGLSTFYSGGLASIQTLSNIVPNNITGFRFSISSGTFSGRVILEAK